MEMRDSEKDNERDVSEIGYEIWDSKKDEVLNWFKLYYIKICLSNFTCI